ncbi:unannotated protein [freshwater metagenome]|uniref:Unannotated protein n=1 Tax=freshwater metagenome TaxID=449393 RepID=A0A6J7EG96_9ZZZZ
MKRYVLPKPNNKPPVRVNQNYKRDLTLTTRPSLLHLKPWLVCRANAVRPQLSPKDYCQRSAKLKSVSIDSRHAFPNSSILFLHSNEKKQPKPKPPRHEAKPEQLLKLNLRCCRVVVATLKCGLPDLLSVSNSLKLGWPKPNDDLRLTPLLALKLLDIVKRSKKFSLRPNVCRSSLTHIAMSSNLAWPSCTKSVVVKAMKYGL